MKKTVAVYSRSEILVEYAREFLARDKERLRVAYPQRYASGDLTPYRVKKAAQILPIFLIASLIAIIMVGAFAGCASSTGSNTGSSTASAADVKSEGVMTHAEYIKAELNTEVTIETYVQGKQSWWENKATVYSQDKDGAYFLYNMACTEDDYAKLVKGTKIKVKGFKSEWSGEIEIIDATFEIVGGSFIATARDVTALLGTDTLIEHQNEFVSFKGLTVEAAGQDADGKDVAFLYNWDGSGEDGNDLYFNVSVGGGTYTFTVESYLCDKTTDVYAAVKGLKIGDKIDAEGFLYWYEGANPHITSIKVL